MNAALADLKQGKGRIVTLIGEAGLGKSRLIAELFKEWEKFRSRRRLGRRHGILTTPTARMVSSRTSPARCSASNSTTRRVIHHKVDNGLRSAGASDEVVSLCSVALERIIAAKVLHEAPNYPAEVVRKDIFDTIYPAWLASVERRAAGPCPDDLQWADAASIDLVVHLFKLVEEAPILFICAFRPGARRPPGA